MTEEDLRARLRGLEEQTGRLREEVAGLSSDVRNHTELIRAIAPLVGDLATVRGVANSALEKAKEVESDLADAKSTGRSNRWQLVATVISILGLLATLVTLIFFILNFAGAGPHG